MKLINYKQLLSIFVIMKSVLTLLLTFAALSCLGQVKETRPSVYLLEGVEPAVYYAAPKPLGEGDRGRTAVILIQGWGGGVDAPSSLTVLQKALGGAYVVSPLFPRAQIMKRKHIARDGRAVWNDSWPVDLTKPGVPDDDWRGGGDANGTTLSSFDVIDTILDRLSDRRLFPKLRKVVLVGFSAGGQFVSRYVAVGKGKIRKRIKLEYAAMSPSTWLFPDEEEIWHYGLKGRPRYSAGLDRERIMENLRTRRCFIACGNLDTLEKSLDKTPAAMKQGRNRYARFLNLKETVRQDSRWNSVVTFHVFDSLGHNSAGGYSDPAFVRFVLPESLKLK